MKKTLIAICGALSLAAFAETQTPAQPEVIRIVTDEHNPIQVVVLDAGTESPRVCSCNPCKCDPCKCGVCEKKTVEFRPAPIPPAIGAAKGTPKPDPACGPVKVGGEKETVEFRPAPIPPAIGAAKGTPKPDPACGPVRVGGEEKPAVLCPNCPPPICRCKKGPRPGCVCPKGGCANGERPLVMAVDSKTTADQIEAFKKEVDAKISSAFSKAVTAVCTCGKEPCACPKTMSRIVVIVDDRTAKPACDYAKVVHPLKMFVDSKTTADQIEAFKKDVNAKISSAFSKAVTAVCTCGKEPCACPKTTTRIIVVVDSGASKPGYRPCPPPAAK